MEIVFSEARMWRYIFSATSKFMDSILLRVNSEGLTMKGIDPSKTALIEFTIPKESFEKFDVGEESSIQLNLEEAGKIMRSAERDDKISLKWNESSITFVFEKRGVPRYFTIPLQSEEGQEIPELNLELRNQFQMPGDVLYEGLSGIENVGEVLIIEGDEGTLKLRSESDLGEAEVILTTGKGVLEKALVENPGFKVGFGMEYFTYLKQPIKIAENVVLRVDADMPAELTLTFVQSAKLKYYVAPRAE